MIKKIFETLQGSGQDFAVWTLAAGGDRVCCFQASDWSVVNSHSHWWIQQKGKLSCHELYFV